MPATSRLIDIYASPAWSLITMVVESSLLTRIRASPRIHKDAITGIALDTPRAGYATVDDIALDPSLIAAKAGFGRSISTRKSAGLLLSGSGHFLFSLKQSSRGKVGGESGDVMRRLRVCKVKMASAATAFPTAIVMVTCTAATAEASTSTSTNQPRSILRLTGIAPPAIIAKHPPRKVCRSRLYALGGFSQETSWLTVKVKRCYHTLASGICNFREVNLEHRSHTS